MTTERQDGPGRDDDALVEAAAAWFVRMRSEPVDAADRRAFRDWLARDRAHRDAYAEAEALWADAGAIADPRTPSGRPEESGAGDSRGDSRHPPRPRYRPESRPAPRPASRRTARLSGAVAAGIAFVAALGWWSAGGYDGLRADHATAVGEIRTVTLADGSMVQLNTGTALAVEFSGNLRRIDLYRGQAFFTVATDPDRPFEVVARRGVSRAVGTAFDVRDAGEAVTVAVEEGRVRVSRPPGGEGGADGGVTLQAGEAARYGAAGGIEMLRADMAPSLRSAASAWREGRLVFANRPLRDVVAELDRYRPGTILFLESGIAEARFTGVFSLRDTDRALEAIGTALAVDVVRLTPYLTLLRARD